MALTVKVDSTDSVAGRTVSLVVAYAGVSSKISIADGAAGSAIELDAGADGKLEGLATVCKYIASLVDDEKLNQQLTGATSTDEAMIHEWLTRASAEYTTSGSVDAAKLDTLNQHLATRSFVATSGFISLADLGVYGTTHGALSSSAPDTRSQLTHVMRWCDHVGAVADNNKTFGVVPFARGEPLDLAPPAEDKKEKEKAGGAKGDGGKGDGNGNGDAKGKDAKGAKGDAKGASDGSASAKPDADAIAAARAAKKAAKDAEKKDKPKKEPMAKKEVTVDVLDIKVGTITKAWEHPGADKLWVESIDVGEARERQVVSGLRAFKTESQMTGARVLVLCNVKKGPLRDEMSEGMVMCASNEEHTSVDFVVPPEGAKNGERVTFAGFAGEPVETLVPKKKMFEACAPKLKTNDTGVAEYDGVPFMTTAGPCVSSLKNCFIK